MKKKLETFISENRDAFDDDTSVIPSYRVFRKRMVRKKRRRMVAAGSFIAAVCLGIFIALPLTKKAVPADEMVKTLEPRYEQVKQMNELIEVKQEELKQINKVDASLYNDFSKMTEMQQNYFQMLQHELHNSPNKDILLKAMIENLEMQLELLNQQLEVFNSLKHTKYATPRRI